MRSLLIYNSLLLILSVLPLSLFAQDRTDNTPGKVSFLSFDTAVIAGRSPNQIGQGEDVLISIFNENSTFQNYKLISSGNDLLSDLRIIDNQIYIGSNPILNTGLAKDIVLAKINPSDTSDNWTKVFQSPLEDKFYKLVHFDSVNIVLGTGKGPQLTQDLLLLKLDNSFDYNSSILYDYGASYFPTDIIFKDSAAYVSGFIFDNGETRGTISKFSSDISQYEWSFQIDGGNGSELNSVNFINNEIVCSGWFQDSTNKRNFIIYHIDENGNFPWAYTFENSEINILSVEKAFPVANDSLLVLGNYRDTNNVNQAFLLSYDLNSNSVNVLSKEDENRTWMTDINQDSWGRWHTANYNQNDQFVRFGTIMEFSFNNQNFTCMDQINFTATNHNVISTNKFLGTSSYNLVQIDTNLIFSDTMSFANSFCRSVIVDGLNEKNIEKSSFYPNPTTGHLLLWDIPLGSAYSLYSLSGKLVFEGHYNGNSIDLSYLQNGMYILKTGNKAERLIIQK